MNTTKPPPGVPDGSRTSMTPHSHDQLVMSASKSSNGATPHTADERQKEALPDSVKRPRIEYKRIAHPTTDEEWLAVVAYPSPDGASWAVVHTSEDFERKRKCMDRDWFKSYIKPRLSEWEPTRSEKSMIQEAREGSYDDLADVNGFSSPISFVLDTIESAHAEEDGS